MDINQLISIIKDKIKKKIKYENIKIEDKTFLHKKHQSHKEGKFHLKLTIESKELKILNKIESNKKIYRIIDEELKKYIHSLQILIE
jgi:BolA family transcriptional regulator, general stress-responsive regulator